MHIFCNKSCTVLQKLFQHNDCNNNDLIVQTVTETYVQSVCHSDPQPEFKLTKNHGGGAKNFKAYFRVVWWKNCDTYVIQTTTITDHFWNTACTLSFVSSAGCTQYIERVPSRGLGLTSWGNMGTTVWSRAKNCGFNPTTPGNSNTIHNNCRWHLFYSLMMWSMTPSCYGWIVDVRKLTALF